MHAENMCLLELLGAYLHAVGMPYIIGADWNFGPIDLIDTGWPQAVGGAIVNPAVPTYDAAGHTSELNYFLVRNDIKSIFDKPKAIATE